jgi:hypothetical protein
MQNIKTLLTLRSTKQYPRGVALLCHFPYPEPLQLPMLTLLIKASPGTVESGALQVCHGRVM